MLQTTFTGGLGYEGKIKLTLKSNNRVLQTKTYKNSGTNHLFKFLGYCLIDSYTEAESLLPTKIMLLYNTAEGANYRSSQINPQNVDPRSEYRGLAQTPSITSDSTEEQVKVVYSFEVPRSALSEPFNQVALYGAGKTKNDYTEFSAYYYLTDAYGIITKLDPKEWSPTTVLLIEWELTLSNKNIDANNKPVPSTSTI
jgi:hypothetical protein